MAAPRSLTLTVAVSLAACALTWTAFSAFVPAPQQAPVPHSAGIPTAALSAAALMAPTAAHAEGGSV
eukprot:CAMPEP_0171198738 /NCGR_PEP_ID=MMETSP0790-20130122/23100_1 /TAXON_ID=2925 /ORGANISM="Alexandrium catenella, Strain OF101" /LENGTH=66 /DNA_ID=CAMNT_0011664057 /DNA_START=72 /DNA_END=269 /DNA_ORIENTATION=+